MNTIATTPPLLPSAAADTPAPEPPPLGELPTDRAPITGLAVTIEAVLREPRRVLFHLRQPGAGSLFGVLLAIVILCSAVYGFVVGTFSGGAQLWAAPVKITAGLLFSGLICLPSLYIFACLGGSRVRLTEVAGVVLGLLALTTILLIGFAPVAWVFSQSTESINAMGALHLIFWIVAAAFGERFLHWSFSLLETPVRGGIKVWVIVFLIVALQMSTALRPIVGRADTFLPTEKKFFVSHWFDSLDAGASSRR